jgi:hypothetical protein
MECRKFECRLQNLLDQRRHESLRIAELPRSLREHAAECPECTELLGGYRMLLEALPVALPGASGFLAADVVELATSAPHRHHWLRSVLPLATAASLLVAVLAVQMIDKPEPIQQATVISVGVAPPAAVSQPPQSTAVSIVPVSGTTLLASPVTVISRSIELMLTLAGLSPVTFSAELLDSQVVERAPWMVQVTDGLKPVTERMSGTLNALLRAWPSADAATEDSQGARHDCSNPFEHLV